MDNPESGISFQWLFGILITGIAGVITYLANWNFRIERKIDEAKGEFRRDLDSALDRQTRQLIQLMDARLYPRKRPEDD